MKKTLHLIASLIPSLLLLLIYLGDTYHNALLLVSVFFGLLLMLMAVTASRGWDTQKETGLQNGGFFASGKQAWWIRFSALVAGGLLFVLVSDRPYQHMVIFTKQTDWFEWATYAIAGVLGCLAIKPPKMKIALGMLLASGLLIRLFWFSEWEINPAKRDMLALIISAIERFLSGENPYGLHQMQVGSLVPLTYPPGLWLLHLPAHLIGVDIRWVAWLADLIIVLALGQVLLKKRPSAFGPVFLTLATYLFLPDIHWNGIYAEPHADWALVAILLAAAIQERKVTSAAILGLALATRPFNLVLLPFYAVWAVRRFGWLIAWRMLLITGAVVAAFYLPFVLWDPDAFFSGTVRWLLEYGPAHRNWFFTKLSFSGPMYEARMDEWLSIAQIAVIGVMFALALWRLRSTRGLLLFWTITYGLFVSFNSIIWMSFWIGVCLMATALLAIQGGSESQRISVAKDDKSAFPWIETAQSLLLALSAALLIIPLTHHFSDKGRVEAAAFVDGRRENDTFVIDAAGYRVAFLKTPFILERRPFFHQGKLGTNPFTVIYPGKQSMSPLAPKRVFAVERFGLFKGMRQVYLGNSENSGKGGPYQLKNIHRFGHYRVYEMIRKKGVVERYRISDDLSRPEVNLVTKERTYRGDFHPGAWTFRGRGSRERVESRRCRIGKLARDMLFAAPIRDATLSLSVPVTAADKWVTVWGGLIDRKAAWHRADIGFNVKVNGKTVDDSFHFSNTPGLKGATFELSKHAKKVTFEILAKDVRKRHFCFDASFSGKTE